LAAHGKQIGVNRHALSQKQAGFSHPCVAGQTGMVHFGVTIALSKAIVTHTPFCVRGVIRRLFRRRAQRFSPQHHCALALNPKIHLAICADGKVEMWSEHRWRSATQKTAHMNHAGKPGAFWPQVLVL
jgi:hypothetical protein